MKPILTQSLLFKQVAGIIGYQAAIKELLTVIGNGYSVALNRPLDEAFIWVKTPQGFDFWRYINEAPLK